jgi:hypothetical protein
VLFDLKAGSGGSGSGSGSDETVPGCDLIHKTLDNFGVNVCGGAAGTLVDLAEKAFRIEEDELANKALKKAGLL